MQSHFQAIVEQTESTSYGQSFKKLSLEQTEQVLAEFIAIYFYGAGGFDGDDGVKGWLITFKDWLVFSHYEPVTQAEFLCYLTAKIALLRKAKTQC